MKLDIAPEKLGITYENPDYDVICYVFRYHPYFDCADCENRMIELYKTYGIALIKNMVYAARESKKIYARIKKLKDELRITHSFIDCVQHLHDFGMVWTFEVAGHEHLAWQHSSLHRYPHFLGFGADGVLLHDSCQPFWFSWQWRPIHALPIEDYSGGYHSGGVHHLYGDMLPWRNTSMESPGGFRMHDSCSLLRVLEVILPG
jgi:hypothetical protein